MFVHPDDYFKKLKKEVFADFIAPHFRRRLEILWNKYINLSDQIDRYYEDGRDEDVLDLEEQAEVIHAEINDILEEIDEGAEALWHGGSETKETVGWGLDEELAAAYQALIDFEKHNIGPYSSKSDWIQNIRGVLDDHLLRDILYDSESEKKSRIENMRRLVQELPEDEIEAIAREAYEIRRRYRKRP